ncbi:protein GLUTAMINE DUMPER 2 [Lactuca sativa]|uniref:Uncharacterized protein n=1 Tax=Lactuca sativa TaxID=4236 RepID=A0A9R1UTM3_LACSA|nr:protein GLUTAMINE DUMPER 2 [Lactuca sativa]KAJ0192678.1 hypothetical protein LSAT_V11C800415650 [Lactuca sativa]
MMSMESTSSLAPSSVMSDQRSPWHSPVPYLFGGLAAMLGLIAFALLILACSYWKLSGYLQNNPDAERDIESGDGDSKPDNGNDKPALVFEEKYLVIMAGQATPTFLATPISSTSSSFGSCSCLSNSTGLTEKLSTSEVVIDKEETSYRLEVRIMENEEAADQLR